MSYYTISQTAYILFTLYCLEVFHSSKPKKLPWHLTGFGLFMTGFVFGYRDQHGSFESIWWYIAMILVAVAFMVVRAIWDVKEEL